MQFGALFKQKKTICKAKPYARREVLEGVAPAGSTPPNPPPGTCCPLRPARGAFQCSWLLKFRVTCPVNFSSKELNRLLFVAFIPEGSGGRPGALLPGKAPAKCSGERKRASGQEGGREKVKTGGEPLSPLLLGPPDLDSLLQL